MPQLVMSAACLIASGIALAFGIHLCDMQGVAFGALAGGFWVLALIALDL